MDTEQLIRDVVKNVLEKLSSQGLFSLDAASKKASQSINSSSSSYSISGFEGQQASSLYSSAQSAPTSSTQTSHTQTSSTQTSQRKDRKIVTGVSVRHVHLCREHLEILFGKGYILNVLRELYNPGYACKETVTIVGPKLTAIQNVRILGPLRSKTQVELAKTDCIILGIDAPVRESGNTAGSASCVLVGPKGAVYLTEGVIRANRHLHMSTEDAEYFGIKDNQLVDIRVPGPKGLTFNNVQVRVAPDFKTEFHVDTDDGNAADLVNGSIVEIVDASCIAPLEPQMADSDKIPPGIPDSSFVGEITDPNVLKNICSIAAGVPVTEQQVSQAVKTVVSSGKSQDGLKAQANSSSNMSGFSASTVSGDSISSLNKESSLTKKILITVADLDSYASSGIKVTKDVILTPLAKDEAVKRGINIVYET